MFSMMVCLLCVSVSGEKKKHVQFTDYPVPSLFLKRLTKFAEKIFKQENIGGMLGFYIEDSGKRHKNCLENLTQEIISNEIYEMNHGSCMK